jgi:hypothetical protein
VGELRLPPYFVWKITDPGTYREVKSMENSVEISLIDITTTAYFISEAMTLEEHKEAGSDGV